MGDISPSERYKRQLQLAGFGAGAQQKMASAKVLVVGAGGLGSPALQYLCGMGIGTIGIVDDDVVGISNLPRQTLYCTEDIGVPKVAAAAARLLAQNPEVDIKTYQTKLNTLNALGIIEDYDVVLDATDDIGARYLINDACVILDKPFVYGAVQQYEGHVSVFNYEEGPTYRCLYPNAPASSEIPDCNTSGILGVVPGVIGCVQALQVVKVVTGIGRTLSGYLQVHDFLNDEVYKIKLKTKAEHRQIKALQDSYELRGGKKINAKELQGWYESGKAFRVLDVREMDEYRVGHLPCANNTPLSSLDAESMTNAGLPTVVYCQKGGRSARAVALMQKLQPQWEILELDGGIENWPYEVEIP